MSQPTDISSIRSISTAPNYSRKHQMAYMRHVEIEMVNRKLLDNMSRIMASDYKSAVKEAISNRKSPSFSKRNVFILNPCFSL